MKSGKWIVKRVHTYMMLNKLILDSDSRLLSQQNSDVRISLGRLRYFLILYVGGNKNITANFHSIFCLIWMIHTIQYACLGNPCLHGFT